VKIDPTLTSIGSSPLTINRIPNTGRHHMDGIGRFHDILVASLYDDGPNTNKVFLMTSTTDAPGISVERILEFFSEKGYMKYMYFTE
jgi:hypothetical protein